MNKWNNYFMQVALETAKLSHCVRLKVGAVAVRDRRIILCGYNGMPAGDDNCCEFVNEQGELRTKNDVSHAEENLITFAAQNGIVLKGATLYLTHAPCINCAKLVRNSGFSTLIFNELYHSTEGIDYLKNRKFDVRMFNET